MKRSGRDARQFCRAPDPAVVGALLHGPDAGMIAEQRRVLAAALASPDDGEMQISSLEEAAVRRSTADLDEALRARGFFPGRRIVVIDEASDGLSKAVASVTAALDAEDGFLILTAGALPARSTLRKLFEGAEQLVALQFFADALTREEIAGRLAEAGLRHGAGDDALDSLAAAAQDSDHGSFLQLLEVIALFGADLDRPLNAADVAALLPGAHDAEVDRLVAAVADGRPAELGPLFRRLSGSGATPVGLLLAIERHFRMLLRAASDGGGPARGLAAVRPPLWGPRRSAAEAQLRRWSPARLEQACRLLFETDARIRSSAPGPEAALVERCCLRLAMMAGR